jgi:two-component system phosphate regulon sensor histidine kinase PhoR
MNPGGPKRRRKLLWHLYPSYLVITLFALLAVSWYGLKSMRSFHMHQLAESLEARGHLVREQCRRLLEPGPNATEIDRLCKLLGRESKTRITVILPDGTVVGDSERDPRTMENHADRPEIKEALAGERGLSTRYSSTLEKMMMYVAVPLYRDGKVAAVVRTSIPATEISDALHDLYGKIAVGAIVIALLAAFLSYVVSRRISRPLEELRRGADRFAGGELQGRLAVSGSVEIGALAEAMNRMAAELDGRIRAAVRQRNELDAVLASMMEGVLAVDTDECIMSINQAGASGKIMQEIVRNPDLRRFTVKVLEEQQSVEGEVTLRLGGGERYLHVNGTPLIDASGNRIGALLVLNDMTRLKKLERMRRDFVANVSHELKTPITSIQGFVETLQTGAINDRKDAERFLGIIAKQTDRLHLIIEDLLMLSRIEQESEEAGIDLVERSIRDVLQSAVETCKSLAGSRNVGIDLICAENLSAGIDPHLLEQAVINLIDNAIKYSDEGASIKVEASARGNEIVISVEDHGCGIEEEHLPRLFERFFRVDQARSRKLGGTGLGLAIVKHIALAHKGRVAAESKIGKGSTFFIYLPIRR